MSNPSPPGPSSRKRSRTIRGIDAPDPESVPDTDEDSESVSDTDNVDVLRIIPDEESQNVSIEPPPYMSNISTLHEVDFGELIKKKYFVDKTEFITRVLEESAWAIAILRHRNSMKTTHFKSIEFYCDWKPVETLDFEKMKVKTNDHLRKYCVIFVPFDRMVFDEVKSLSDLITTMRKIITDSVRTYLDCHISGERNEVERIIEELTKRSDSSLLHGICYEFYEKFSKNVIILMDNVDVPFLCSAVKYAELAFKTFLNSFTADHSRYCFKLITMGNIAPHIFFKLSSFGAKMFVDTGYESGSFGLEHFMFTEEDIKFLCNQHGYPSTEAISQLKLRYGGYHDNMENKLNLFNSFSVIQFFNSYAKFELSNDTPIEIMWYNFHSKDVLHVGENVKISKAEQFIWTRLLNSLQPYICANLKIIPDFSVFFDDFSMGAKYLLYGGYLTVIKKENYRTLLAIPNQEVKAIFSERRDTFMSSTETTCSNYEPLNLSLNEYKFDEFCKETNKILIKCSSRTFDCEKAYHVFLLVILACNNVYKFIDEPETGLGISDIVLKPKISTTRKSIVIELAYLETKRKREIERMFEVKLTEVKSRQYGLTLLDTYKTMDILILVGCNRTLQWKLFSDVDVPS